MELRRIASFEVNHNKLKKGIYISRIDGDVITYDVRCKMPNSGDYLPTPAMHTFEHLFATYARNSEFGEQVVYVGPMGCRTGFYLLTRYAITYENVIKLVRDAFEFTVNYKGRIPGSTKKECGNYKEHDLKGAKKFAKDMLTVLENYTVDMMQYEK